MIYKFDELVTDSRTGLNPRKNFKLGKGNNNYITIKDIQNGRIVISDKTDKIDDDAIRIIQKRSRIKNGDILFSSIGRVGDTAIVTNKDDSWDVNESVFIFTINKKLITPEYFCHLIGSQATKDKLNKNSTGSTFKSVKMGQLNKMMFVIPSMQKQKIISDQLRNLKQLMEMRAKQLSEYDLLIKSRFVEMFESFEKTDLCNIAEIIMGQSPDSAYYNENGVGLPFFQGKADFGAKYTNVSYWTTKPSKTAKKGNVLMSVRAPVGPVNISSVDCCIGRGLCSINAIPNKTNNEFLYNALIAIQDQITAMGTGSTFKAINKSDVYAIQLPLAPISLQNEFANFVEQVDKLKFAVQQSLNETQQLFDSLMQEYFG